MTNKLTINKVRRVMYKSAKYLGDIQAIVGAGRAIGAGNGTNAVRIILGRISRRVYGHYTGRGLSYIGRQTRKGLDLVV